MKKITQINCVCCPNHCLVTMDETDKLVISGNRCENGYRFALGQLNHPDRQIIGEVRVSGGKTDRCPVKTDRPVPTTALDEIQAILREFTVQAPVTISQPLIRDIARTGANLIASRSVPASDSN